MKIYVDNAATTRMSEAALEVMLPYFTQIYGNPSSVHEAGQGARNALLVAREKIASLIHATPREIIFTSGGTESDNMAICSAARLGAKQDKRHIISTQIEHHAVLNTLKKLESEGFEITLLPVNENGIVDPESLVSALKGETCLVSVMFANNEIGTIQPIREIGRICREQRVLFHTDAVQAAGHLPIDVKEQNIDLLSLSAHKFHGPKGVGALYARRGIDLARLIEGGGQERSKRPGTENVPAIVGMAEALRESCENMERNSRTMIELQDALIEEISKISGATLNGDRDLRLPSNINFSFEHVSGEELVVMLNELGICASSGAACTSGSIEPSHVLMAVSKERARASSALRISLSHENTMDEMKEIISSLKTCLDKLR